MLNVWDVLKCLNVFELTIRTHHLKKSYEAIRSVVKIDIRIYPTKFKPITIRFILHNADRQPFPVAVDTFVKTPSEKLNTHNAEDEPEHHAHQ